MIKKCTTYLTNQISILKKTGVDKKLTLLLIIQTLILFTGYFYIIYNANQRTGEQWEFSTRQINSMVLTQAAEKIRTLDMVTTNLTLKDNLGYYSAPVLSYLFRDEQVEDASTLTNNFTRETRLLFTMFPSLSGMYLYQENGRMIAYNTAEFVAVDPADIDDEAWIQQVLDIKGKMTLLPKEPGSRIVYGARSLINVRDSFEPKGILIAGINVSDIDSMFRKQRLNQEQEYAVFDGQGELLFGNGTIWGEEWKVTEHGTGSYQQTQRGEKFLYQADYDKEQDLYSVIRTPQSSINLNTSYEIVIMLLLFILITIVFFLMIIKSITTPIKDLVSACRAFGRGDFSSRMNDNETSDLGYLSSSFNQMADKVEKLINEVYVKNLTERDLEIQMLRNQINPHFLYNTLENMRMTAYTQGFYDLAEMCKLLAEVLRYGVSDTSGMVTVKQEMEHLNQYIELQQRRFLYAIQINCMAAPEIEQCKIIKLLLQPLVENSINHGFREFRGRQSINIFGYRQEDKIIFEVADNGSGMEPELVKRLNEYVQNKNMDFKSIGLKNVNRRIVLSYGKEYGMYIKSQVGKGTSVTITLPFMEAETEEKNV